MSDQLENTPEQLQNTSEQLNNSQQQDIDLTDLPEGVTA